MESELNHEIYSGLRSEPPVFAYALKHPHRPVSGADRHHRAGVPSLQPPRRRSNRPAIYPAPRREGFRVTSTSLGLILMEICDKFRLRNVTRTSQ